MIHFVLENQEKVGKCILQSSRNHVCVLMHKFCVCLQGEVTQSIHQGLHKYASEWYELERWFSAAQDTKHC